MPELVGDCPDVGAINRSTIEGCGMKYRAPY